MKCFNTLINRTDIGNHKKVRSVASAAQRNRNVGRLDDEEDEVIDEEELEMDGSMDEDEDEVEARLGDDMNLANLFDEVSLIFAKISSYLLLIDFFWKSVEVENVQSGRKSKYIFIITVTLLIYILGCRSDCNS